MARILVIDDDRHVREGVVRYLNRIGHEVHEAHNGKRGLQAISEGDFALIITDINMPEMDGIELINALRDAVGGAPVVAMSGGGVYPKELLLGSAQVLGAVSTLAKPFELEDLRRAVDVALAKPPNEPA